MKQKRGIHYKGDSPATRARREAIEAELASIPPIASAAQLLTSFEGFIDYYLRMYTLYPTQYEAYESLERYHIAITGKRRYSEFDSFRNMLNRYLTKSRKID